MTTININEVFDTLDARRAAAQAVIAQYTAEQVAEASRVALLYDRCAITSVKHAVDTVRQLREMFGAPNTVSPFDHLFGTPEQQAESARAVEKARATAAAQATAARAAAKQAAVALGARECRTLRPHCNRCGGKGYLPSFTHIRGGACFACN